VESRINEAIDPSIPLHFIEATCWAVYNDGFRNITGTIRTFVFADASNNAPTSSLPVPGAIWLFGSG
jgi:hypothetical protein